MPNEEFTLPGLPNDVLTNEIVNSRRFKTDAVLSDAINDWRTYLDFFNASFEVSNRGDTGLGIFIQDQTTPVLTVPFLKGRAALTLALDTVAESRTITLEPGHGVTDGEVIELADLGSMDFMQSQVITGGVNGNVITLDQPVNRVYTVADSVVQASSNNLLVDGSSTPQVFSVLPLPNQQGDMVRIILEMRGDQNGAMDFTTFGSQPELLNGCVLRVNNGDGTFKNLFNFKSNSDFIEQGFDHVFLDPKGGNTVTGFMTRVTWGGQSKHGVVIRIDGDLGEALELVIQDNLTTGNTRFHITAQGHELQG